MGGWDKKLTNCFSCLSILFIVAKCFSRFLSHLMNVNKFTKKRLKLPTDDFKHFYLLTNLFYIKIFTLSTFDILRIIMLPFSLSWCEFEWRSKFIKILICFCYYVRSWEWKRKFWNEKFLFWNGENFCLDFEDLIKFWEVLWEVF